MFFRDVIGQEKAKNLLISQVKENRVSHAQLFLGPAGCGKLPLALAYANYLNCSNKQVGDICGECPSCKKNLHLGHPDVSFTYPYPKKDTKTTSEVFIKEWVEFLSKDIYRSSADWEDFLSGDKKQFVISVEESSSIMEKANYKPFENGYKIFWIWQPEKMNNECANKLLKLLEEPPPKTVFLMISDAPEKLLDTIISRTQIVNIPRIEKEDMQNALIQKYPNSDESTIRTIDHL